MDNLVVEILLAIGAMGWIGTSIVALLRTPANNRKEVALAKHEEADAAATGVEILLNVITALEKRIEALEMENKRLSQELTDLKIELARYEAERGIAY